MGFTASFCDLSIPGGVLCSLPVPGAITRPGKNKKAETLVSVDHCKLLPWGMCAVIVAADCFNLPSYGLTSCTRYRPTPGLQGVKNSTNKQHLKDASLRCSSVRRELPDTASSLSQLLVTDVGGGNAGEATVGHHGEVPAALEAPSSAPAHGEGSSMGGGDLAVPGAAIGQRQLLQDGLSGRDQVCIWHDGCDQVSNLWSNLI